MTDAKSLDETTEMPTDKHDDECEPSLIHFYSGVGNVWFLKFLLKRGANTEVRTDDGLTPLHISAGQGQTETTSLLIEFSAYIEATDKYQRTPLHHSSNKGHVDVSEILIKNNANKEANDTFKWTPLHLSSNVGHADATKLLIKFGVNINPADKFGRTPLHHSSNRGTTKIVEILLQNKADTEARDEYGWTPILHSSYYGHLEITELLIKYGAKMDVHDNNTMFPLHHSATNGRVDLASLLVKQGANLEARDKYGWTPIMNASYEGQIGVAKILAENKADLQAVDSYGFTAIHFAIDQGHSEVTELLIKYGADVKAKDVLGKTAVHHAADKNRITEMTIIIENLDAGNNKELDLCDNKGLTPIHYSSGHGYTELTELLITNGASINIADNKGMLPLHHSSSEGHSELVELLIKHEVDMNKLDAKGNSALDWALIKNRTEVEELLLHSGASRGTNGDGGSPRFKDDSSSLDQDKTSLEETGEIRLGKIVIDGEAHFINFGLMKNIEEITKILPESGYDDTLKDINERITINPEGKYSELISCVHELIAFIVEELQKKDYVGTKLTIIKTGSMFAGLKVMLPLEVDYLVVMDEKPNQAFYFSTFYEMVTKVIDREFRINNIPIQVNEVKKTSVSCCLVLELRSNEETFGFLVDLVPVCKSKERLKIHSHADKFMEAHGCRAEDDDIFVSMLSTRRDCSCDGGIIMHKMSKSYPHNLKVALKIAKYLYEARRFSLVSKYHSSSPERSIELFGRGSTGTTFHIVLCLLHIAIALHQEVGISTVDSAVLVICTLKSIQQLLARLAEAKSENMEAKLFLYNPVFNVSHGKHFELIARELEEMANDINDTIDYFVRCLKLKESTYFDVARMLKKRY